MCVICYTNDVDIENEDIRLMWDENPQGAGFAWIDNGQVFYSKGYMTYESLVENLPKDRTNLMIHFRISTGGNVDSLHCHPYNIENVMSMEGKSSKLIFHNGYFDLDWDVSKEDSKQHNDTFLLTRDILPLVKDKKVYDVILSNLCGSKFALFDATINNESWFLYGKWQEYKGMSVSNLNFSLPKKNYLFMRGDDMDYFHPVSSKIAEKNEHGSNPFDDDVEQADIFECSLCQNELTKDDEAYGICEDCTAENGIYCMSCGERMGEEFIYNNYFCNNCE